MVAERIKRFFGYTDEQRALTVENFPEEFLQRTAAGVPVSPRGAMAIADAYACIRCLSDAAASLPLHVYRRTSQGRERVQGGVADLLRNPAPAVTQSNLIAQTVAHLQLWGEAFVGLYRDQDGAVVQVGLLAPDRVTVEQKGGMLFYGYGDENGRYQVYSTRDVLHIKGLLRSTLQVSEPPYGLRHSYASLRIREGASIPELAEELGHSPHMTLTTYSHVINELRGAPPLAAVEEVAKARREVDMRGLGMALREPLG